MACSVGGLGADGCVTAGPASFVEARQLGPDRSDAGDLPAPRLGRGASRGAVRGGHSPPGADGARLGRARRLRDSSEPPRPPLLSLPPGELAPWGRTGDVVALIIIAVSVALWRHTRRHKPSPGLALDLALGYEVFLAFGLGLVFQWQPQGALPGRISWICLLVLLFPMIVPNTPRKTLVASLLAASMDPLAILIAHWRGLAVPSVAAVVWNSIPNYVCAVLAMIPSVIVTRLGRQVHQARELGSYRLGELIGRGGMGEVWRATHRMLARPAAVKLINPEVLGAPDSPVARAVVRRSVARPRRRRRSSRRTRFGCTTSARPARAPSTSPWSCSTGWTWKGWWAGMGRCRPSGPSICCARSATRWERPTREASFTAM
jgi:hypothetical protein